MDAATRAGVETARELCRRRALAIVTRRHYFALRNQFLVALEAGTIGMGDLLLGSDDDLLHRVQQTSQETPVWPQATVHSRS